MEPGRTPQLWIVPKEGDPISLGLFEPQESGRAIYLAEPETPISDAAALAISEKPDSGSPVPSSILWGWGRSNSRKADRI